MCYWVDIPYTWELIEETFGPVKRVAFLETFLP